MRKCLAVAGVAALAALSCAEVVETVRNDDRPLRSTTETRDLAATERAELSTRWVSDAVEVQVEKSVGCEKTVRREVDRTVFTERHGSAGEDSFSYTASAVTGAALLAGGAALLGTSHLFSSAPNHDDEGKETLSNRGQGYVAGGILAGVGLMMTLITLPDAVRLKDSKDHVGLTVLSDPPVRTRCSRSSAGEVVTVTWPDGKQAQQAADEQGRARFPLPDDRTLLRWKAAPMLKVAAAGATRSLRFDQHPRFVAVLDRERAELARQAALQAQAEKSLEAISKGDAMWISMNPRDTGNLKAFAAAEGGGTVYALTARGDLVRSQNGGLDWSAAPDAGTGILTVNLDPRDPETVVASGADGQVRVSHDHGDSWVTLAPLPREGAPEGAPGADVIRMTLVARDPAQPEASPGRPATGILLAATDLGLFRTAAAGGDAWTRFQGLPSQGVRSVAQSGAEGEQLVVVLDDGRVFRSASRGAEWLAVTMPDGAERPRRVVAHPSDPNLLYVVAGEGTILRSRDGGETFERAVALPAGTLLTDLRLDPKNPTVVYAATTAGILWSTDLASSFRPMNNGLEDAGTLRVEGLGLVNGELYALGGGGVGLLRLGTVTERQTMSNVSFDTNSAALRKESQRDLDGLVAQLARNPALMVRVDGHTDDRGSEDHNRELSWKRARSVSDYLQKKGIQPSRIVPNGFGPRHPVAPNDTDEGRQRNRRVEIYLVGKRAG